MVISDIGLPDGSGLELASQMVAAGERPRLIALSGYGRDRDIRKSVRTRFDDHPVKPLDLDCLRAALSKYIFDVWSVR